MVHQEFMLIPGFTVTENIKVGREISHPTLLSRLAGRSMELLDFDMMARDARKALKTIGLKVDENSLVRKGKPDAAGKAEKHPGTDEPAVRRGAEDLKL